MNVHEVEGPVTVREFADAIGVTPARVRQMVEEGKLPKPTRAGPRASVWRREVLNAVLASHDGGQSAYAVLAPAAERPLRRTFDGIVEYEFGWLDRSRHAHVRVWAPGDPAGLTVVLLGRLVSDPGGVVNSVEGLAEAVVDQILPAGWDLERVAWFDYHPMALYDLHQVSNVVFHVPAKQSSKLAAVTRTATTHSPQSAHRLVNPSWDQCGLAVLERIVGESVECYPEPAYQPKTIELWQRARGRSSQHVIVDVEHDAGLVHETMTAIAKIEPAAHDAQTADLGSSVCQVLASRVSQQLARIDEWWYDGTRPPAGELKESWPTLFAARLRPPRLSVVENELYYRYTARLPEAWPPATKSDVAELRPLLDRCRQWLDETGPFGDRPDSDLHQALKLAESQLTGAMHAADEEFASDDYPETQPRLFEVAGPYDRRYLDSVRWSTRAGSGRRRRELAASLADEASPKFGVDPGGHLIAHSKAAGDTRTHVNMEWPQRPLADALPPSVQIVADGAGGDRPAWLEFPDGRLRPMPRSPDPLQAQWNFGYGGGGPAALEWAIARLIKISDQLDDDQIPMDWIRDQVQNADQSTLRISVDDIRRRVAVRPRRI